VGSWSVTTDIEVYFNFSSMYMILKGMEGIGCNKYKEIEKNNSFESYAEYNPL